jgi:hypothetical protein
MMLLMTVGVTLCRFFMISSFFFLISWTFPQLAQTFWWIGIICSQFLQYFLPGYSLFFGFAFFEMGRRGGFFGCFFWFFLPILFVCLFMQRFDIYYYGKVMLVNSEQWKTWKNFDFLWICFNQNYQIFYGNFLTFLLPLSKYVIFNQLYYCFITEIIVMKHQFCSCQFVSETMLHSNYLINFRLFGAVLSNWSNVSIKATAVQHLTYQ